MSSNDQPLPTMARILFWLALLLAFVMALLPAPPQVLADDKSQHMLAFGTLTLLMGVGWPRVAMWRIGMVMAALGAAIEVAQGAFPALNRDADIADWYADMAAVLVVLAALALLRAGLRKRSPEPAE